MPKKSETLSLRASQELKGLIRTAASREHRSLSNMVEVMVLDYCKRTGMQVDEMTAISSPTHYEQQRTKGSERASGPTDER